jgi:hypothetical protein
MLRIINVSIFNVQLFAEFIIIKIGREIFNSIFETAKETQVEEFLSNMIVS